MNSRKVSLAAWLTLITCLCVPAAFAASTSGAADGAKPAKSAPAKLDLNSATAEELQQLPGVGPANAKKIIDNRPYKSVSDLSKAGVPASTIKKISGKVTVKRSATASAEKKPAARTPQSVSATPKQPASAGGAASTAKPGSTTAAESGKVWLNTDSNVYHKAGSRWYGNTKSGKYVTEQEAQAAGARESKE